MSGEEFAGTTQGILFDFWVVGFPIVAIILVSLDALIRALKTRKGKIN